MSHYLIVHTCCIQTGISGGQKKRVSIAMELVKESSLFFLDGLAFV